MEQLKFSLPDQVAAAYRAYIDGHSSTVSAMTRKLVIAELSRRGVLRDAKGEKWVKVPETV